MKVRFDPARSDSDLAQSKTSVDEWLENTLPPHEDLQPGPEKADEGHTYSFSVPDSVVADPTSWEQFAQSKPRIVHDAKIEIRQPTVAGSATLSYPALNTLVDSLNVNKSIMQNFPTTNGRYTEVRVLPLIWDNIETHHKLEDDLNKVCVAFQERFNFEVDEIFKIPSEHNAIDKVRDYLRNKIPDDECWDKLLVVVYAGHGLKPNRKWKKKGPMVFCDNSDGDFELDWSEIQCELDSAKCDVLVILNCCYGGNAALSKWEGTNEILSAADRDSQTFSGKHSFLKYLARGLNERRTDGRVSIESLSYELDVYNTAARQQILRRPLYKRFPDRRPSIVLQRLEHDPYHPQTSSSSTPTGHRQSNAEASFFVEYILTQPEKASQGEWNQFFANSSYPNKIKGLRFYSANNLPFRGVPYL